MEVLLINLKLMGLLHRDLSPLAEYCQLASTACGVPIPDTWPLVGRNAFRTANADWATGLLNCRLRGQEWLSEQLYSAVPASWVGGRTTLMVGPGSGESNVLGWLLEHGCVPDRRLVGEVLARAQQADRVLSVAELEAMVLGARRAEAEA
jgi:isopropylmalate/homocitrate/citramalate synthase